MFPFSIVKTILHNYMYHFVHCELFATLWKKKAKLESPLPLEILAVGGATEVWIFSETTQYRIHVCQKVDFWSDLHEICGCHGKITIMDTQ